VLNLGKRPNGIIFGVHESIKDVQAFQLVSTVHKAPFGEHAQTSPNKSTKKYAINELKNTPQSPQSILNKPMIYREK
jgi:hypothetical protein